MTTSAPTQVILAAFPTEYGAENALVELKNAKKQHLIDINNVAVLRCDAQGKVHIKEPTDMGAGRGAAIGAVVGGLAGLLFGPVGWAVAGGAAVGGVAAKLRDSGFQDSRLREVGKSLQPGTSALLAVIEHIWVTELEAELARAGGDVATHELAADIAAELKSGHAVAYTAVLDDDSMVVARVAADSASPTPDTSKAIAEPKAAEPETDTQPAATQAPATTQSTERT